MSHQLHRLTLSKTVKKQGEDLKNNEGEWTGKEHVWKRVQNVEIGTIHKKKNTHTSTLTYIHSLSLTHTHTHTHTQKECKTTHGPGEASPFCVFFMYLGPSVLNVVSRLSTSTLWAISDTGGRSLLILCWGQGIHKFISSIFFHRSVHLTLQALNNR